MKTLDETELFQFQQVINFLQESDLIRLNFEVKKNLTKISFEALMNMIYNY